MAKLSIDLSDAVIIEDDDCYWSVEKNLVSEE